jgi:hypothetical protein
LGSGRQAIGIKFRPSPTRNRLAPYLDVTMSNLKSIKALLEEFETLLYGFNYECGFNFELVAETTNIIKISDKINETFNLDDRQKTQQLFPITFIDFKADVAEKLSYRGDETGGHGLELSEVQEKRFHQILSEFWSEISKIINSNSKIYIHPEIRTWIFWGFCYLIINEDSNTTYLFEGVSSD